MYYNCKLVNPNGYVEENFMREGDSKEDVLNGLSSFQWGKGRWVITEIEE